MLPIVEPGHPAMAAMAVNAEIVWIESAFRRKANRYYVINILPWRPTTRAKRICPQLTSP